jgi:hypothetical protein
MLEVGGESVAAGAGFGALTAFEVATADEAELRYETPSGRIAALCGQAVLWVVALVAASRLRRPAWISRQTGRGDRRAVIELAEDVDLPTDAGDVPVMVPLEPVAAGAREPAAARAARPLFRADDEASRAAWVDEMFAAEDEA